MFNEIRKEKELETRRIPIPIPIPSKALSLNNCSNIQSQCGRPSSILSKVILPPTFQSILFYSIYVYVNLLKPITRKNIMLKYFYIRRNCYFYSFGINLGNLLHPSKVIDDLPTPLRLRILS